MIITVDIDQFWRAHRITERNGCDALNIVNTLQYAILPYELFNMSHLTYCYFNFGSDPFLNKKLSRIPLRKIKNWRNIDREELYAHCVTTWIIPFLDGHFVPTKIR